MVRCGGDEQARARDFFSTRASDSLLTCRRSIDGKVVFFSLLRLIKAKKIYDFQFPAHIDVRRTLAFKPSPFHQPRWPHPKQHPLDNHGNLDSHQVNFNCDVHRRAMNEMKGQWKALRPFVLCFLRIIFFKVQSKTFFFHFLSQIMKFFCVRGCGPIQEVHIEFFSAFFSLCLFVFFFV